MSYIMLAIFCIITTISHFGDSLEHNNALCSYVRQMSNVCFPDETNSADDDSCRVGKAGPIGPEGPSGKDAQVDYDRINTTIDQRMEAILMRLSLLEELVTWYKATNGYMYKVITEKATYEQAISNCSLYGARLAISGIINPSVRSELRNLTISSGGSTYVGADDRRQEGSFVWLDGTPVQQGDMNWRRGQPDNAAGRQDCALFADFFDFEFDDMSCEAKLNYLCEKRY